MKGSSNVLEMALLLLLATAAAAAGDDGTGSRGVLGRATRTADPSGAMVAGIPRGGGWFGKNNNNRRNKELNEGSKQKKAEKKYRALTKEEIEEKLDIPVFGIASNDGRGIAVGTIKDKNGNKQGGKVDEDTCYFFMDRQMANQALQKMRADNEGVDLKLATLSLGRIWFTLLHQQDGSGEDGERRLDITPIDCIPVAKPDGDDEPPKVKRRVNFRLVAGARDFFLAKLLTSLSPEQAEQLRIAVQEDSKDVARDIVQKAVSTTDGKNKNGGKTDFASPLDQIPLFVMPQMRVRVQKEEGAGSDGFFQGPVADYSSSQSLLPVFLSSKDMVGAYLGTQKPKDGTELSTLAGLSSPSQNQPIIQLIELHELVKLMQEDSDFDYRSMVLFSPTQDDEDEAGQDSDDDNDGGGGDFGISKSEGANANDGGDEFQIDMFPMMADSETEYFGSYAGPVSM